MKRWWKIFARLDEGLSIEAIVQASNVMDAITKFYLSHPNSEIWYVMENETEVIA